MKNSPISVIVIINITPIGDTTPEEIGSRSIVCIPSITLMIIPAHIAARIAKIIPKAGPFDTNDYTQNKDKKLMWVNCLSDI